MNDLKMYRVIYSHPTSTEVNQQKDFTAHNWEEANKLLNKHFKGMIIKEFRQAAWIRIGYPDGREITHIY